MALPCSAQTNGHYALTIEAAGYNGRQISLLYVVQNAPRRAPLLTVAFHDWWNQIKDFSRRDNFIQHPCTGLVNGQGICRTTQEFQMTPQQSAYSGRTAFDRGHLSPANPFRFTQSAVDATFYCVNIAPQDPTTNQQQWNSQEQWVETKLAAHNGYVMTGVCDTNNGGLHGPTRDGLTVPSCYWKLICYRNSTDTRNLVVGFVASNTMLPVGDSDASGARTREARTARTQSAIMALLSPESQQRVLNAWTNSEQHLLINRDLRGDPPPSSACRSALTTPSDVLAEWHRN